MAENNGEFIEREGQLPPDPAAENVYGAGLGQKGEAADRAPLISPSIDYDVRSIFDSRPINGYDFNLSVTVPNVEGLTSPITASLAVREGFVMVIRRVEIFFSTPTPPFFRENVSVKIRRNGADYPDNTQFVGVDGAIDTFLLADEFDRIDAIVTTSATVASANMYAVFHGTYLLKTGRPFYLEIANPAGKEMITTRSLPSAPKKIGQTPVPVVTPATPQAPVIAPTVPAITIGFIRQNVLSSAGSRGAKGPRYIPAKEVNGKLKPLDASELVKYASIIQATAKSMGIQFSP